MARRVVAGLAALAAALAGAAAASSTDGAAVERGQSDPAAAVDAANAVLDARERALAAGDQQAWMATVDPEAPDAFKDAQARHFAGLRSVPLERFALEARFGDTGDLAPEADRFLPETRMSYRFDRYDDRDVVDTLWLTFVQRGDRWLVASDTDVADLGLDTSRGLWDFGEVRTRATDHFIVLHHPEQADRADALAAIAEDAMARVVGLWDKPWSRAIPIVLPADVDELEQLLQSTIDLDKFVAFVSYGAVRDTGWQATAPRMYIQDQNLSAYGRDFQVETIVHELAHAAGAPVAGPLVPAWLHEGVADWLATGRRTNEGRPRGSDGVLPRDYEFTTGSQEGIIRSYAESRSVISYLAGKAGTGAPTSLFAAVGEAKVAPGSVDRRVDDALRALAGFGLPDLQRDWSRR
ncbi:MAG TPA: hypothetical protein VF230_18460 [Acidimicrobiales bacterium]